MVIITTDDTKFHSLLVRCCEGVAWGLRRGALHLPWSSILGSSRCFSLWAKWVIVCCEPYIGVRKGICPANAQAPFSCPDSNPVQGITHSLKEKKKKCACCKVLSFYLFCLLPISFTEWSLVLFTDPFVHTMDYMSQSWSFSDASWLVKVPQTCQRFITSRCLHNNSCIPLLLGFQLYYISPPHTKETWQNWIKLVQHLYFPGY